MIISQNDRQAVFHALEALRMEYREAIVMREMHGLSYKEIAEAADVPIGTVMSRLARARDRLRLALGGRTSASAAEPRPKPVSLPASPAQAAACAKSVENRRCARSMRDEAEMNCEEARLLVHAYADGELALESALEIERHLAECAGCARERGSLAALSAALGDPELQYSGARAACSHGHGDSRRIRFRSCNSRS